ncbi:MAG: hypothetical protein NVSMB10_16170 [Steroidobacteraceae bacterium]
MQDAGSGAERAPHITSKMLESVSGLNQRFLEVLVGRTAEWHSGTAGAGSTVGTRIAGLSTPQKAAVAQCPYALFDLHFCDAAHWRRRLADGRRWSVAELDPVDASTLEFVRLALFFSWHVATTTPLAARLILGMAELTVGAFRDAALETLPLVAAAEATSLTARWSDCTGYWSALTRAASLPDALALRRVQLYGLQLAAGARLA